MLQINGNGDYSNIYITTLANGFYNSSTPNFFDGNPHFICFTYAATVSTATSTSFISTTIDTTNITYSTQLNVSNALAIQQGVTVGSSAVGETYYMNRLGVWNRILNSSEISYLYNNGNGRSHDTALVTAIQKPFPMNNTSYFSYGKASEEITRTRNRTASQKYWSYGKSDGLLFPSGLPNSKGIILD
jgi:hypothetical protein